jgi:hypothetical protein
MKKYLFKLKVVLLIIFTNDKYYVTRTRNGRPVNFYEL